MHFFQKQHVYIFLFRFLCRILTTTTSESKQKVAPKVEESEQIYLGNGKQKSLRGSKGQAVTEEKETRKQVHWVCNDSLGGDN